jgi:hypothetical protein
MAEEVLDGDQRHIGLEQMHGFRVAERVRADGSVERRHGRASAPEILGQQIPRAMSGEAVAVATGKERRGGVGRPRGASQEAPLSLPNGTELLPYGHKGLGRLRISNGTAFDAVVKLLSDSQPPRTYRMVYVRTRSSVEIDSIPTGPYVLKYALGVDWDEKARRFRRGQSYARFDDRFLFGELPREHSVWYWKYDVTLHPVVGGSARTSPLDENAFEEGETQKGPSAANMSEIRQRGGPLTVEEARALFRDSPASETTEVRR